jgi:hypothetical protein
LANGATTKPVACTYELDEGSYTVKPDGSGTSLTSWKPAAGNDPQCATGIQPGDYARGNLSKGTSRPGRARVQFFLTAKNRGYQMGVGPLGFAEGNCAPEK